MSGGSTLLAFDFDGTLAPIREDPDAVRLDRGAAALLESATRMPGVVVAVISGRDADDLSRRLDSPGVYIVASHGLEVRGPGGELVRDSPPLAANVPPGLRALFDENGLRLEEKKHGVALHWRGRSYDEIAVLAEAFRTWARVHQLGVIEGRCVVEARCPGSGKEQALQWLTHAVGAGRVVYAGDDNTDFGPLRFAAERGVAVFVASSERAAPPGVTVVASFRELFRLIREEVLM